MSTAQQSTATAAAAVVSLPQQPIQPQDLKPARVHKDLAKKMQQCTVYACVAADKFSTKWKRQRRLLVATSGLLLVCTPDGSVRRAVDLKEVEELALQQDGAHTVMLVRLAETKLQEPDLLAISVTDPKRSTHPPARFFAVVAALVRARRPAFPAAPTLLAEGGPIKGMARLGHNPISAKAKLAMVESAAELEEAEAGTAAPDGGVAAAAAFDSSAAAHQTLQHEQPHLQQLPFDSRPTSEASGPTPIMRPLDETGCGDDEDGCGDLPLSPLHAPAHNQHHHRTAPGPISLGDDLRDILHAGRTQQQQQQPQPQLRGGMPQFSEVAVPPQRESVSGGSSSVASSSMAGAGATQRRKPRSVSFSTPGSAATDAAVRDGRQAPAMRGAAAAMPPVKSLPEDDEGGCGWTEHRDPVSHLTYYHNEKRGKSTWHEPEELKAWKAAQGHPVHEEPASSEEAAAGGANYATTKKGILLQHQHHQRTRAAQESDDDSDDAADSDSDESGDASLQPERRPVLPRLNSAAAAAQSLDGIARLLDGPAVKVRAKPAASLVQPSFDELPVSENVASRPSMAPMSNTNYPQRRYTPNHGNTGNPFGDINALVGGGGNFLHADSP